MSFGPPVPPGRISLLVSPTARDEEACLYLVDSVAALGLCRHDAYRRVTAQDAIWELGRLPPHLLFQLRSGCVNAQSLGIEVQGLDDLSLVHVIKALLQRGDLVGVKRDAFRTGTEADATVLQRRLVRKIEVALRGRLLDGGRQYKLTTDVDLDRLPDREYFEIVPRDSARQVLENLGKSGGQALQALLLEARGQLTRDWRPPMWPDGLILLRRTAAARVLPTKESSAPFTPSQLQAARNNSWIEIETVDQDGQPVSIPCRLELPDGTVVEGTSGGEGLLARQGIQEGSCKLTW